MVIQGDLAYGSYFILIALIFDFLDGFAARILRATSPIGKELDSLADMVTFGFLPALIMFFLIEKALTNTNGLIASLPFIAFSLAVFSAIRLAKFNVDTRQTSSFIGVPTPANAVLIGSLPLISPDNSAIAHSLIENSYFLTILTIVMSYLLISPIRLFALKFSNFSWSNNKLKYIFLFLSLVLFGLLNFASIPIIIILYIILSVIENSFLKLETH